MGAHFITGTGTDIGKTWLACALLRHWRGEGRLVAALKPVLSGFDLRQPQASDAGALLAALGREANPVELDAIAPWRFAAPLSPDMAAAREGRSIDFDKLVTFTRHAVRPGSPTTLVEGVGGVMAPLDTRHTVRDWIAASDLPCVLVSGSYLGSLSHALTALAALQQAGARVTAIAVNESPDSAVALEATLESLSRHAAGIALVGIVRDRPLAGVACLAALLG